MSVTTEARDAFRLAVAVTTGAARRQISMSEMLIVLSKWAEAHPAEVVKMLTPGEK